MNATHPFRIQCRNKFLILLLRLSLFCSLLGAGFAAAEHTSSLTSVQAATLTKTIPFNDCSGCYLGYTGKNWYLYNAKGKKQGGLQYLSLTANKTFKSGFYIFDKYGKLLKKKGVYRFSNVTVNDVKFDGVYYANASGCFDSTGSGLTYLSGLKLDKSTYSGYYYVGAYGKLNATAQVRYLSAKKVNKVSFTAGYYYFTSAGKLCTAADFHNVKQSLSNKNFDGSYYFGEKNGKLRTKAGWVTYKNKKYYVSSSGQKLTNCWQGDYYLQQDGTMAKSKQLPDGTYVDSTGKKCSKVDFGIDGLRKSLASKINSYSGTWSVYVKDLSTDAVINLNEQSMYPASTIKAFVMASTFNQIKNGKLAYNSQTKSLLNLMITVSDNEAYNELVRRQTSSHNFVTGTSVVNSYLSKNGYKKTACHRTLHPSGSPVMGNGSNKASAKDCGVLLEHIYKGTCVSKQYSKEMLNLLLKQQVRHKIPSGIPSGVKVANKTGETNQVQHDMAIVYGPKKNYILVVFSSTGNEYYSTTRIRDISKTVYNYLK